MEHFHESGAQMSGAQMSGAQMGGFQETQENLFLSESSRENDSREKGFREKRFRDTCSLEPELPEPFSKKLCVIETEQKMVGVFSDIFTGVPPKCLIITDSRIDDSHLSCEGLYESLQMFPQIIGFIRDIQNSSMSEKTKLKCAIMISNIIRFICEFMHLSHDVTVLFQDFEEFGEYVQENPEQCVRENFTEFNDYIDQLREKIPRSKIKQIINSFKKKNSSHNPLDTTLSRLAENFSASNKPYNYSTAFASVRRNAEESSDEKLKTQIKKLTNRIYHITRKETSSPKFNISSPALGISLNLCDFVKKMHPNPEVKQIFIRTFAGCQICAGDSNYCILCLSKICELSAGYYYSVGESIDKQLTDSSANESTHLTQINEKQDLVLNALESLEDHL